MQYFAHVEKVKRMYGMEIPMLLYYLLYVRISRMFLSSERISSRMVV